jgi:hypothetical protein
MTQFESIINELTGQEQVLQKQHMELASQLSALSSQLTQIRDAIKALSGVNGKTQTLKPVTTRKQTPTDKDVVGLLTNLLRDRGSMPITELEDAARSQLLAKGFSRVGLKQRVSKAIRGTPFFVDSSTASVALSE